jgi:hypothetical protein
MNAQTLMLKNFVPFVTAALLFKCYALNCVQAKNFGALTLLSHNKTNYTGNHLAKGPETEAQKRQILWFDCMIFIESCPNLCDISDWDNKLEH